MIYQLITGNKIHGFLNLNTREQNTHDHVILILKSRINMSINYS